MLVDKEKLESYVSKAVYRTLEVTCYMFPVEADELQEMGIDTNVSDDELTSSVITFEGAAEGAVFIAVNDDLYHALASNMLGEDTASKDEKDAALCEIANIICGNIVPFFAKNGEICKINPPEIGSFKNKKLFESKGYGHEKFEAYVDEGIAKVTIYFKDAD
ncbi:MAG: chemotaxis protein CheX [Balneolia bacterium]|nr:chemotaxis protein CheX [Balneolia bacterium]